MKKLNYLVAMMLTASAFSVNAEETSLCTFEDGETGYQLCTGWYQGFDWAIVDNTDNSGINTSDKCVMCTSHTNENPDSWGWWFTIFFDEPITVSESNRYMKMMVKRTPNNVNISAAFTHEGTHGEREYLGMTKPLREGEWGDLVFDLFYDNGEKSLEGMEVSKLFISIFGTWDGLEHGVCFLDNIVLSNDPKPRGAQEVASGLLANFEDEALTSKNFANFIVQSPEAKYEVVDNPKKDDVNDSEKCLNYFKPANTVWWHAGMAQINGIIPVEYPDTYLHVMTYVPDMTPFVAIVKDVTGKSINEVIYPEGDGWVDNVIDVSELTYVNGVDMRFNYLAPSGNEENWENEAGNYYVDDIVLNSDPEQRSKVESGVENVAVADANAPVEYFNLQGVRVAKPENGLFIVKQGTRVSKQVIR